MPALRHLAHTYIRRGLPSTRVLTRCTLGSQRLLVLRWEWLMLYPKPGPLPQISHLAMETNLLDAPKYVSRRGGKGARDGRTGFGAAVSRPEGDGAHLSFALMHVIARCREHQCLLPLRHPPGFEDSYGPGDRDVAFRGYPFSPSGPAGAMGYNLPVPGNGFPVPDGHHRAGGAGPEGRQTQRRGREACRGEEVTLAGTPHGIGRGEDHR